MWSCSKGNLRVRKTDSLGTRVFLYDGATCIAEATTAGAITARYTTGISFRNTITEEFYRENAIGSTLQTTNYSGTIQSRYEYDGYGVAYTLYQSYFTPYLFAGKHGYYSDGDSGMNLLGHRYYLPVLGRFLTQDPLGHEAGLNPYQYVSNNPLIKVDANGLAEKKAYIFVGDTSASIFVQPFVQFGVWRDKRNIANRFRNAGYRVIFDNNATETSITKALQNASAIAYIGHNAFARSHAPRGNDVPDAPRPPSPPRNSNFAQLSSKRGIERI